MKFAFKEAPGQLALGAAVCLLLACQVAQAEGRLVIGFERLAFRDDQLGGLYGAPLSVGAAVRLMHRGPGELWFGISMAAPGGTRQTVPFIDRASASARFVPLWLQARFRHALGPRLDAWAGPQLAWAWFEEEWRVRIPGAGLAVNRAASGAWPAGGLAAGLRYALGAPGALRLEIEQLWCGAQREALPGTRYQAGEMDGGWWLLALRWELPW